MNLVILYQFLARQGPTEVSIWLVLSSNGAENDLAHLKVSFLNTNDTQNALWAIPCPAGESSFLLVPFPRRG